AVAGRADLLDGLAALTEADARAAGPKAWTKNRAALIGRLVRAARHSLPAGKQLFAELSASEPTVLSVSVAEVLQAARSER
ncbi:MAG: hypothetical protein LBO75_03560, partial [Bifidobacteriaceae bacterium]|nr:hypothetical protein [Bifidobacteriaceae bacterium]